jgi:hypothetical protein
MTEQPKEPMHDQLRRALPDQPELALALSESINEALTLGSTLTDVGARQDEMGQYVFDTPKVIFYDVGGDWEIDIITVEGFVGFDVQSAKSASPAVTTRQKLRCAATA